MPAEVGSTRSARREDDVRKNVVIPEKAYAIKEMIVYRQKS